MATDGIIKGEGNSRLIRASSSIPETWALYREQLMGAGIPIDLLFNEAGWQLIGSFLNKNFFLTDATETAIWGNAADRTPDEALAKLQGNGAIRYTINARSMTRDNLDPLSVVRNALAAATDGNGNVLFLGGSGPSDAVDKYTPAGEHSVLTPLSVARYDLAAATDGNGNVLAGGGRTATSTYSDVVDRYTTTGVRTTLTALSSARHSLAAATDGNGNVLFAGGNRSAVSNVVNRFTPAGVTTTLTALSVARYDLAAATDGNGNALFLGGTSGSALSAADMYTPAGVRSTLEPLPTPASGAAATDGNGNVLFVGGNGNVVVYAPGGTLIASMPFSGVASNGRRSAATDGDGNVLRASSGSGIMRFSPGGIQITATPSASETLSQTAAATDGNGNVLFAGGGTGAVNRFLVPRCEISVPFGARYQFEEHAAPQTALVSPVEIIRVITPNTGYVQFTNEVTL